jgi:hypothetical protein
MGYMAPCPRMCPRGTMNGARLEAFRHSTMACISAACEDLQHGRPRACCAEVQVARDKLSGQVRPTEAASLAAQVSALNSTRAWAELADRMPAGSTVTMVESGQGVDICTAVSRVALERTTDCKVTLTTDATGGSPGRQPWCLSSLLGSTELCWRTMPSCRCPCCF